MYKIGGMNAENKGFSLKTGSYIFPIRFYYFLQ